VADREAVIALAELSEPERLAADDVVQSRVAQDAGHLVGVAGAKGIQRQALHGDGCEGDRRDSHGDGSSSG